MDTLKDVKQIVRSIIGDPDGDWATDAYLIPMVNHIYRLQINYLAKHSTQFMEDVCQALNVPIGTVDLTQFQKAGKSLYGLRQPVKVEWKQAGFPATSYCEAEQKNYLPDMQPGAPTFKLFYTWRKMGLYVTPLSFVADFRVTGDFNPPPLLKDDDTIAVHIDLSQALAEEVAACAQRERGNAGQMQTYELVGTAALDDIASQLVGGEQGLPVRLGRITRRRVYR